MTFEWDATESGRHAFDYLTTFDRTVTGADPCTDCGDPSTYPIPIDSLVTAGPDDTAGTADDITQIAGNLSLYGGTIDSVSAYSFHGDYSGTSQRDITVNFTASVANPVLAWGGHLSLRTDWVYNLPTLIVIKHVVNGYGGTYAAEDRRVLHQ